MTLFVYVNGVQMAVDRIRLRDGTNEGIQGLTSSADGSGSQGGIIFDDPSKTLTLQGWQPVIVTETDCSQPRLFTGYVADRVTSRGPYVTDGGRQLDTTINDANVLLSLRLIDQSDGKRPIETREDRVNWLLSTYLSGLVYDVGWLRIAQTTLAVADYRGQYATNVLDDIVSASEIYFARYDPNSGKVGLFLDYATSTVNTSTLRISNVLSDVDNSTTFYPLMDATLTQDPSEVYSKVRLVWAHGITQNVNATTASTFFPSPLLTRGLNVDQSRIGAQDTATREVNGILTRDSEEQNTIQCTVYLPSTVVGLVDAGDRIAVKFSHFDGFDTFTYVRVMQRTVAQVPGDQGLYAVGLTLTNHGRAGGGGGGGVPIGNLPLPPVVSTETTMTVVSGSSTSDHSITVGLGDYVYFKVFTTNVVWAGTSAWWWWFDSAAATAPFAATTPAILKATNGFGTFGTSLGSWTTPDQEAEVGAHFEPSATQFGQHGVFRPNVNPAFGFWGYKQIVAAYTVGPNDSQDEFHLTPGTYYLRMGNDGGGDNYFAHSGYTAVLTVAISQTAPEDFAFMGSTSGPPPQPGMPVVLETPTFNSDGANYTYTTAHPFADTSLHVYIDQTDQTAAVTSFDGTCGDFTLAFDPRATDSVIQVDYQGR